MRRPRWATVLSLAVMLGLSAAGAELALASGSTTGYDISYPQCNAAFPTATGLSIVGVNKGIPYQANPCLGAGSGSSELQWAGAGAGLYANTADPGPALSTHWPNGQSSPQYCDPNNNTTTACAYDYGWNAAADSFQDAKAAYASLGWTMTSNQWWLDVESANSWTSNTAMNVADLQGAADYLKTAGASGVGFYANAGDWSTITGGTTTFSAYPSWTPGAGSLSSAQSNCLATGVTGGPVALTQYLAGSYDGDVQCSSPTAPPPSSPALSLSGGQALVAGSDSGSITVAIPAPAPSGGVSVTLSTTSSAGVFHTVGGTTAITTVTIPGDATSATFTYRDTNAGSPTITATAAGYTSATQTETVSAAALHAITISPAPVSVRVGSRVTLTAAGTDQYGNAVNVLPSWSVTSGLGTFSQQGGATTAFKGTSVGTGSITATSGSVSGSVPVTVTGKHR